jgi:hypothetical protein
MTRRILLATAVTSLLIAQLLASSGAHARVERNARTMGLLMAGLRAAHGGPCAGFFQLQTGSPRPMCSHGPDPAPAGVDVTQRRNVADLTSGTTGDTVNADGVPCVGDGTSGPRVQAVYAVASDATDRYSNIVPLISQWAG